MEHITSKSLCLSLRPTCAHHKSHYFRKKKEKNMFFSPKINKNREEGRREGEVEMEVGRKGREKEAETRR